MNIEDAIYAAAHAYPGGVESLAPRMGLLAHSLRHKVSPTYPNAHLSPRQFVQFCELTGFSPLHAMCAELGHVALPLPHSDQEGDDEIITELAQAMREDGEFAGATAAAWADRAITREEIQKIEREALDSIAAKTRVVAAARRAFDQGRRAPAERMQRVV